MGDEPLPQPPLDEERDRLIAELERRASRPRVGVLPPVAAVAVLGSLFLLASMRGDLAYFFSSRQPIELGAEGDYRFAQAVSNRYAQVHGLPSARGWYVDDTDGSWVVVGVVDAPLLVRRVTFPAEAPQADGRRPQPLQNPFFARGRLLSRADAGRYLGVFDQYEAWSGTRPEWLLLAEQPPGQSRGTLAYAVFLASFAALNGFLLIRGLRLRRR